MQTDDTFEAPAAPPATEVPSPQAEIPEPLVGSQPFAPVESDTDATDAVALMNALGYPIYNVYGISYGTRLALVMMRDHPDAGMRSVVLDSSFPPEIPGFERFVTEAHEVVMQLFSDQPVLHCTFKRSDPPKSTPRS